MSDTPRTDSAILQSGGQWSYGLRETCEQLERELAEALKQRDEWFEAFKKNLKEKGNLSDQLAEAREKVTTAWTENIILDSRNRQLERELAEARKENKKLIADMILHERMSSQFQDERDTLAEALRGPVNAAKAADSPGWSEPGESGWYVEEYERTNAKNWLANTKNWLPEAIEALAAVEGGKA